MDHVLAAQLQSHPAINGRLQARGADWPAPRGSGELPRTHWRAITSISRLRGPRQRTAGGCLITGQPDRRANMGHRSDLGRFWRFTCESCIGDPMTAAVESPSRFIRAWVLPSIRSAFTDWSYHSPPVEQHHPAITDTTPAKTKWQRLSRS